ncbi:MAG: Dabb family protein [Desulfuromonadales bacterium]|nr:Dabb family protein [Desulfuromonadales bacterium]
MITHVVVFKFKPEATEAEIQHLAESLGGLPQLIEEIREFRFGADVIRSERSYDLGLVSSFDDLDALQRYQIHPEHQKVVAQVKAIASNVVSVDFSG